MKKIIFFGFLIFSVMFSAGSFAQMGGGHMMTNSGGFGMTTGMAGAPVVGDDGTAYIISHNPTASVGTTPTSSSFESLLTAVKLNGEITSITLNGMISRPVVVGNVLVATTSLPNFSQYNTVGNYGTGPLNMQSVLYVVSLPLAAESVPLAVSMDGNFASIPVIAGNHVYVTTTDFGNAMMQGNTMFNNFFGGHNFSSSGTARSFLYVFNLDGSLASRTEI
jgi:hypothetical protein